MSSTVVVITGSPSGSSRSTFVARSVVAQLERSGFGSRFFSIADFDPADLVFGRTEDDRVRSLLEAVAHANALILSTPVYKGTYAGGLKTIVDLLPYEGLVERPLLGIATARVEAHLAGVEQGYRGLAAFFRARHVETLGVLDGEIALEGGKQTLGAEAQRRALRAAEALASLLRGEAAHSAG